LGITEPIIIDPPSAKDIKANTELERILREFNLFENVDESRKREEVLGKLNVIVKEWARHVSLKKVCYVHAFRHFNRNFTTNTKPFSYIC
jgi:poly(A) polymerase